MRAPTEVYAVQIVSGKHGFPVGEWTRVCYRAMAAGIVDRLARNDGVTAKVVPVMEVL